MSQTKLCRLCVKVCTDYASLYNETGQKNNICEITLKYFDPMFLNADHVPGSGVLCMECCGHISVFHNFQQAVFQAQERLREGDKAIEFEFKQKVSEELVLDNMDNSHVTIKQDDSISLPGLELMEEFMFTDSLQNENNRINSQTVIEPIPQCQNTEDEEDTEQPLSTYDTVESEKGSDSESTTRIKRKRKQNANEPIPLCENTEEFDIKDDKINIDNSDSEQSEDHPLSISDTSESENGRDSDDNQPTTTLKRKRERKQNSDKPLPTLENTEELGDKIIINNFDTEQSKDQPTFTSDTWEKGSDSDGTQPTMAIKRKLRRSQRSAPKDLDAVIAQRKPSLECVVCKKSLPNFKSLSEHFRLEYPTEPIPMPENTQEVGNENDKIIINNFDTEQSKHQPISTSDTSEKGSDSNGNQPITAIKRKLRRSQRSAPKDLDAVIAQRKPSLVCVVCKKSLPNFKSLSEHFRLVHPNEPIPMCENTQKVGNKNDKIIINNFDTEQSKDQPISTSDTLERGSDSDGNQPKTRMKRKHKRTQKLLPEDFDAVIAQWKPRLDCVVCKKSMANFLSLRKHFRIEHPNESCRVECCNRRFYHRCRVAAHARLHFNPDKVKCNQCDSYYVSRSGLRIHMSLVHFTANIEISDRIGNSKLRSKFSLECVICKTSFEEFFLLKSHYRQDHPAEVFYVLCCERKFNRCNEFKEHMQLHRDPNAFKCEICGKRLCRSQALSEHMRLHRDPNAFKCEICGKRMGRPQTLTRHMRLCHSNIKTADP